MRPDFNTHSDLWADDGALRDVYVRDLQLQSWDCFDSLFSHHELAYSFDGRPARFPGSRVIFNNREGRKSQPYTGSFWANAELSSSWRNRVCMERWIDTNSTNAWDDDEGRADYVLHIDRCAL